MVWFGPLGLAALPGSTVLIFYERTQMAGYEGARVFDYCLKLGTGVRIQLPCIDLYI